MVDGNVEARLVAYSLGHTVYTYGSAPSTFTHSFGFEDQYENSYWVQGLTEESELTPILRAMLYQEVALLTLSNGVVTDVVTARDLQQSLLNSLLAWPPANPGDVAIVMFLGREGTEARATVSGPLCVPISLTNEIERCVEVENLEIIDRANHGKFVVFSYIDTSLLQAMYVGNGVFIPVMIPVDAGQLDPDNFAIVDFS